MEENVLLIFILSSFVLFSVVTRAQMPGFISMDCGGTENFIDDRGLEWVPDDHLLYGESANISVTDEDRKQYRTVRYFPADNRKYCYTLNVKTRTRYLVRASFLYGNFDRSNVYPKFDISIGATHWSTIVVSDANAVISKELILLASFPVISVCLSNATTGQPFISTLELRQLNGSLYFTPFETEFFIGLSARINFGAENNDLVRYPDDPFDRIWESDSGRANYLVDVAPGTEKVSTLMPIDVNTNDRPPEKVMKTAVVGRNGSLTYRLNLDGFPGFGWSVSYFAEIEDFGLDQTRKFKLFIPRMPEISKPTVNVQENAQGKYRSYEPGYQNLSLPFVFSFEFKKTNDSSMGPILNALEIYYYIQIRYGSQDASVMSSFVSHYPLVDWAQEGGDPCLPASWSWVQCSSDPQPKIVSINLSGKNLTGDIPSELTNLSSLVELWLDGNSLTGPVPDLHGFLNLEIIHLENNQLTGVLPESLVDLPSLKELYLQNNMLSGSVTKALLNKNIIFNYSGNKYLRKGRSHSIHIVIIICSIFGVCMLLMAIYAYYLISHKKGKFSEDKPSISIPPQKPCSYFSENVVETAHRYPLYDIQNATKNFGKRIGSGGFGIVYYGKMKDEKEIAVKVLMNDSCQGNKQFSNEVSLISRIHHRNLVSFLGYCQQEGRNILVYEYMHNGTLKEHLHGCSARKRSIRWIKRLEIAEDAAKGIEYLHTGCSPTIIHRDLKSSNILLDKHMRAKVADFGLSKPAVDESQVSSMVRGTFGYLDPEYYTTQQFSEKSDVYSFGIILLELISGQEPISNTKFGEKFRNISQWAKFHIESGDVEAITDPLLQDGYNIQSVWKIAEVALECVNREAINRPSISEVLKEIQEAITLEQEGPELKHESPIGTTPKSSMASSKNRGSMNFISSVRFDSVRYDTSSADCIMQTEPR